MRLIIRDDKATASKYIADYIIHRIKSFAPTPEKPFVLGLPTGSSPEGIYKNLVAAYKANEISFRDVVTFNMDEYVGIPRDHPESYHTFMWQHFFQHVDIDPANIHILDGNAADLEEECIAYEEKIRRANGIELFLGGIGPDGHIAFNEPGSSLQSRTRVKTLAYDTILANSRFFDHDVNKVPKMALTVGIQTVLDAREVVIIITGAHKALALQKCIEGGVNHMWTLSSLQMHPHAMIVVDEDATLELQVKTVKYFKSIEQVAATQGFNQALPAAEKISRKRDSVLDKLQNSPKSASPTDKAFLAGPKPDLVRQITRDEDATSAAAIAPPPSVVLPSPATSTATATATAITTDAPPAPSAVPTATASTLSVPRPELTRAITPELIVEPMHDRLEEPSQTAPLSDSASASAGLQRLAVKPSLVRSITPELVPEAMHERIPEINGNIKDDEATESAASEKLQSLSVDETEEKKADGRWPLTTGAEATIAAQPVALAK